MADTSDVNHGHQTHPAGPDEEGIFAAAVGKRSAAERAAYLAAACGADTDLRERVEQLLASHDRAGDFLEGPPPVWAESVESHAQSGGGAEDRPEVPGGDLWPQTWSPQPGVEAAGSVVGPYRLVEKLGEGGMGVVYLADQDRPVRRTVALKIIKPGMDSEQVIARFAAERQALALMDHPHIARVLDAGATGAGRPYFVMELVRGVPITKYCDEHRLTPRQRLELFVPVCHAVQHAHTKGIIHRDIKPSNVLVTEVEGRPVPKVIDFGVAKATQKRLTERTMFTRLGVIVGTPEYMSPEQADPDTVGAEGVDARSDVYSLGVLLYELLTGTTPLEVKNLREAGWQQMLKVIREAEPPRPSTRLSAATVVGRSDISAARSTDPRRLARLLAGDLDWVVMKALEKDRGRRYETANGLARDVERYLTDEPVEARPPSAAYKLRKFGRKHRAALRVAAGFAALLVGASAVSTWQAVRATAAGRTARTDRDRAVNAERAARAAEAAATADRNRAVHAETGLKQQRDVARAESARAGEEAAVSLAVTRFLTDDVLGQTNAWGQALVARGGKRDLTVVEALDRAAAGVRARFAGRPREEAAVRNMIGVSYRNLGAYDKARMHLEAAFALAQSSATSPAASQPGATRPTAPAAEPVDRRDAIQIAANLAGLDQAEGRTGDAEGLLRKAADEARRFFGPDDQTTLGTLNDLAGVYTLQHRSADAARIHEQVLAAQRRVLGPRHPDTLGSMNNLALSYIDLGRPDDADPLLRDALAADRAVFGDDDPRTLVTLNNLGVACQDRGALDEAEGLFRATLARRARVFGPEHPSTLHTLNNLAAVYEARRRPAALALRYQSWDATLRTLGDDHPDTFTATHNLAIVYSERGHHAWAAMLLERAVAGSRRVLGTRHPNTLRSMQNLSVVYRHLHRWDDAEAIDGQVLELRRQTSGDDHPDTLLSEAELGALYEARGRRAEARSIYERVLATCRRALGDGHPRTLGAMSNLANLDAREGRLDDAERLWTEAVAGAAARVPGETAVVKTMREKLDLLAAARRAEARYKAATTTTTEGGAGAAGGAGESVAQPAADPAAAGAERIEWGAALCAAGAFDDAAREMRAVVDAREAAGDLRGAIDARRQLAWVLYNAGELGPAADASYALVTDACRALGTADPLTRDAVREYVQFAGQCGQFDGRQLEQVVAALGGPESVNTVVLLSDLGAALVDNGNFAAAEGVLRRVVGLLAEHRPNGWGRPLADSRLGGALAGQGKFTEAEPLLVGGYEGLKTKESTIPPAGKSAPTEAAERLVWMYEAWGKANNANKAARRAELAARLNAEYPLVDPPAGGQAGSPAEAPTAITPRTAPATLPAKAIP